jgi:hypothetical protein
MSSTDRSETVTCVGWWRPIEFREAASGLNDEEGSLDIARGFLAQRTRDTYFGAVRN